MNENEVRSAVEGLISPMGKVTWDDHRDGCKEKQLAATFDLGDMRKRVRIGISSSGSPKAINEFVGRTRDREGELILLIAPYISGRGLDLCRMKGISCLDLSGNAYVRTDGLLIDRQGRENRFKVDRKQVGLFSRKSSWVIRTLLTSPRKGWTIKELADISGVSLAQAFKVTEALQEEGYLIKDRGNIHLADPSGLLDAWAASYRMEKSAVVGYYSPLNERAEVFERLRHQSCDYALTMGAGADLVAPAVRSSDVYMYTKDADALKKVLELVPVEFGGNIYLVEPKDGAVMKNIQNSDGLKIVSDLQLYLDLYNYPQRGREQADMIRARRLMF